MRANPAVEAGDGRQVNPGRGTRWADRLVERTADVALAAVPVPMHILDVGCGDGALLREMLVRVPYGEGFAGVDPDPEPLGVARRGADARFDYRLGVPHALPFDDACFDLVVATAALDRWPDLDAGLAELARVVRDTGRVVLVERSAGWLRSEDQGRSPGAVRARLDAAGLRYERGETLLRLGAVLPYVRAFIASR